MHRKGLEFPYVYMVGMEEGIFAASKQHDEDNIEEERRLAWRRDHHCAQKELTLHYYVKSAVSMGNWCARNPAASC